MNLLKHNCAETHLSCTKCAKPVCSKCMKVAPGGVCCQSCVPTGWKSTIVPIGFQSMMRLQAASVMLSLMFVKLMSIVTPCLG